MTKTQANEPGFVLESFAAVADTVTDEGGWKETDVLELIAEDGDREFVGSVTVGDIRRAALAAAPIVPVPAYGVKEALEPFAKAAGNAGVIARDEQPVEALRELASLFTVGDLRRARTAFEALSSAPVEEADAKAGLPKLKNCGRYLAQDNTGQWFYINHANMWQTLQGPDKAPSRWARGQAEARDPAIRSASTIPSEPEAKGEAGAGPAGEAVAWAYEVLLHDDTWRTDFSKKPPIAELGGAIRNVRPLYARPVEEPGEVERLRAEGFALAANQCRYGYGDEHGNHRCAEIDRLTREVFFAKSALAESEQNAQGLASDLAGTQAELAEALERMEKLLEAAGKARTALAGFTSADDAAFALDVAIGDLADWKRRAALSTHTAAGTGPVGEIAADLERAAGKPLVEGSWGSLALEPVAHAIAQYRAGPVGEAVAYLSRPVLAGFDPNGTEIANAMLYPKGTLRPHNEVAVYTRPVDEPGEVERDASPVVGNPARMCEALNEMLKDARAERDKARRDNDLNLRALKEMDGLFAKSEAALTDAWFVFGDRHELSLADEIRALMRRNAQKATDLAETREALNRMVTLYEGEFDPETIPPRPDWLVAVLSTQESSAALAGDEKEAGR